MGPCNVIMGPWIVIRGRCKMIMVPCNVIMGDVIWGPWNVKRGPWNMIMVTRNVNRGPCNVIIRPFYVLWERVM